MIFFNERGRGGKSFLYKWQCQNKGWCAKTTEKIQWCWHIGQGWWLCIRVVGTKTGEALILNFNSDELHEELHLVLREVMLFQDMGGAWPLKSRVRVEYYGLVKYSVELCVALGLCYKDEFLHAVSLHENITPAVAGLRW